MENRLYDHLLIEYTQLMRSFLAWLDDIADVSGETGLVLWLDRAAFAFLVLMVVAAPHSIAATQTAWLTGMTAWLILLALRWQRSHTATAAASPLLDRRARWLGYSLWAFFLWSVVSSIFSYEPAISIDRLRGVSIFLIFLYVVGNVRSRRSACFLALVLIFSCMINVAWTPVERLIGRGVEIHGMTRNGPLDKAAIFDGDTLLEVNKQKVRTPEDVVAELQQQEISEVKFYRPDFDAVMPVRRSDLLPGETALEKLGIAGWSKSHNWRSRGFYGHYTTYAEVLQLIVSLLFGIVIAGIGRRRTPVENNASKNGSAGVDESDQSADLPSRPFWPFSSNLVLIVCLAGMCFALLLTVTRASQLAFMISAFLIIVLGASRKMAIAAMLLAVPVVLGGLLFLQQSRNTGFFDPKDESTRYRFVMWRDGMRLWTDSPRNLAFGVGMDSIQKHWREWGLYEGGYLPMGHFHSTLVQILVERGLPALAFWLVAIGLYIWILVRALISLRFRPPPPARGDPHYDVLSRGIMLGCLGGAVGFFASGIVHNNLGDQEVAMVFYLLMGLGVRTAGFVGRTEERAAAEQRS